MTTIINPIPRNDPDKVTIEIVTNDFNAFFYYLFLDDPARIISVSDYKTKRIRDEVMGLVPADISTTVILFSGREVTFHSDICIFGHETVVACYTQCARNQEDIDFYAQVIQEIKFYKLGSKKDGEILIQEFDLQTSLMLPRPVKVKSLSDLFLTSGVVEGCTKYIDSCEEICTMMICGEFGTGKLSLVKALALHYNRPLMIYTYRPDLHLNQIRNYAKDHSIVCIRDANLMAHNPASLNLFCEMLKSPAFIRKKCIVILISYDAKAFQKFLYCQGRVEHIAKLEPLTKNEQKQMVRKLLPQASEDTLKSFWTLISHKNVSTASIIRYIKYHGDDLLQKIDELIGEQYKLYEEVTNSNADKMYT